MGELINIKILIADRYQISRTALKTLIQKSCTQTVQELGNGEDLFYKIEEITPDLLIIEYDFEDGTADKFLPLIKGRFKELKILMLSFQPLKTILPTCLPSLDGFVSKVASGEEISAAIRLISDGNYYYYSPEQRIKKK